MNKKTIRAVEIGAGVAAAVAVAGAAGYYFYGAKGAKKHRAAASKWAVGLKKSVAREAKKLGKIDAKSVSALVDNAAEAYEAVKTVKKEDLTAAVKELKSNWHMLSAGTVKKAAKKVVKKAAAKASSKKRA